jgi:hypothetical protein
MVSSVVLEVGVLLVDQGTSVWAEADEAEGQLGRWGVRAATVAETARADVQVWGGQCEGEQGEEDERCEGFHDMILFI